MKKNYIYFSILLGLHLLNSNCLNAQSTEDFESETTGTTTFIDNSQGFTITNGSGETTYDIEFFASGGWNGSTTDNKFIDNSSGSPTTNDGSSFTISTTDGADISIKSLYLFVAKRNLTTGVTTNITITGKKDGVNIYTIVKSSGIIDGATFTPDNGFTFIDFSSEGGIDNSNQNVDEIIFSTTGNADYLALDAFTWGVEVLSTNDLEIEKNKIIIFPNPSSESIQISKIKNTTAYEIYNVLGKRILLGNINAHQEIKINELGVGIYMLKLEGGKPLKFVKK